MPPFNVYGELFRMMIFERSLLNRLMSIFKENVTIYSPVFLCSVFYSL
jgi:hypothetical protein